MFDYFISGWSFFFRWPVANASTFRPLGVFLGPFLQSFVFVCFSLVGLLLLSESQQQWAPAFGFLGLSMLTGFFHEDGLADTADSLGVSKFDSGASLEKIHSTFKDPRLGTFGVSALVMLWAFRLLAVSQSKISILVWALVCLTSRASALALGLAFSSRSALAHSARSSHVMQSVGTLKAASLLSMVCVVGISVCFSLGSLDVFRNFGFIVHPDAASAFRLFACAALALGLSAVVFAGLVRRTEALNGDLLGASVCLSEVFLTICILRFF